MDPIPQKRLFRFGVFEADQQTGELRKQGRRLPLPAQPFDILVMLLERPGELVSRAEIQERIWADGTFVDFDHSLNTAINKIRDLLGDSAASPRYIETLARRGYRFIARVQVDHAASGPPLPINSGASNSNDQPTSISTVTSTKQNSQVRQTLLTTSHEMPRASRGLVRSLFFLLQLMYLVFYLVALARMHAVEDVTGAWFSRPMWIVVVLIVTAVVGIPIRLYLISAVVFRAPRLREKFLRLFAVIFPLDTIWALAPFLLLEQIGHGLALGCTAILLYAPFAQRSLILMGAGESADLESAHS